MKIDLLHNKIVQDNITEKFKESIEVNLIPKLKEKFGEEFNGICMYESYLSDDFILDTYFYYPMTVYVGDQIKTQWIKFDIEDETLFRHDVPYAYLGEELLDFKFVEEVPDIFIKKMTCRRISPTEGAMNIKIHTLTEDPLFLKSKYSQTFVDEMSNQITKEIERNIGVKGLDKSTVELQLVFASQTYMEHTSENVTYRRLLLCDKSCKPKDFWVKWTRLDSPLGFTIKDDVNAENIKFELGEDVPQKIREKEFRFLCSTNATQYQAAMGKKNVTDWRNIIKRAIKRGDLEKVQSDYEVAEHADDINSKLTEILSAYGKTVPTAKAETTEDKDLDAIRAMAMKAIGEEAEEPVDELKELDNIEEPDDDSLTDVAKIYGDETEELTEEETDKVEEDDTSEFILGNNNTDISHESEDEFLIPDEDEQKDAENEEFDELEITDTTVPETNPKTTEEPESFEEPEVEEIEDEAEETTEATEDLTESKPEEQSEIDTEETTEQTNNIEIEETEENTEMTKEEFDFGQAEDFEEIKDNADETPAKIEILDQEFREVTSAIDIMEVQKKALEEAREKEKKLIEDKMRAEIEAQVRLKYEAEARKKAEDESNKLREEQEKLKAENERLANIAKIAEENRLREEQQRKNAEVLSKDEAEKLKAENERLANLARIAEESRLREEQQRKNAEALSREEAEKLRAKERELQAQIDAQRRQEARERERLAEAARIAVEAQKKLEAERLEREEQQKQEIMRREEERLKAEENARLAEAKRRETERLAKEEAERKQQELENANANAPEDNDNSEEIVQENKTDDGAVRYVHKVARLFFRGNLDLNIIRRIKEIVEETIQASNKESVHIRIKATPEDDNTITLDFLEIPENERELLVTIVKAIGNGGIGVARIIVE